MASIPAGDPVKCGHGLVAPRRTSRTEDNPNRFVYRSDIIFPSLTVERRDFYCCPKDKDDPDNCAFFCGQMSQSPEIVSQHSSCRLDRPQETNDSSDPQEKEERSSFSPNRTDSVTEEVEDYARSTLSNTILDSIIFPFARVSEATSGYSARSIRPKTRDAKHYFRRNEYTTQTAGEARNDIRRRQRRSLMGNAEFIRQLERNRSCGR